MEQQKLSSSSPILEISLQRIARKKDYTIGRLSVQGEYLCDTLEPTVRELRDADGRLQRRLKVQGKTAIPEGRYPVYYAYSAHFGMFTPRLSQVPLFDGILIHPGNTSRDTRGCILPGENRKPGQVANSWTYFAKLRAMVKAAQSQGRKVEISII